MIKYREGCSTLDDGDLMYVLCEREAGNCYVGVVCECVWKIETERG